MDLDLIEATWRVCEGVTLTHRAASPACEAWFVQWTVGIDDWRARGGRAEEALRVAADVAPGRYRDALLAAAANPPGVPGAAPLPDAP